VVSTDIVPEEVGLQILYNSLHGYQYHGMSSPTVKDFKVQTCFVTILSEPWFSPK
jgi:hypothetical protein